MQITRSKDQETMKGPADWFTGDVYMPGSDDRTERTYVSAACAFA